MHTIVDLQFDAPAPAVAPHALTLVEVPAPGHLLKFEDGSRWTVHQVEHVIAEGRVTPTLHLRPVQE
jgi:hypothetical protein